MKLFLLLPLLLRAWTPRVTAPLPCVELERVRC